MPKQSATMMDGDTALKEPPKFPFVNYETIRLLSDPLRVEVFAHLCEQQATAKELATATGATANNVRHALARLSEAKWIEQQGSGRGTSYRAIRPFVISRVVWDDLPLDAKHAIAANLMRLLYGDARGSMEAGMFIQAESHLSLTPLVVDERGRADAGNLISDAVDGLLTIQAESNKRLAKEGGDVDGVSLTVAAMCFESRRDPAEGIKASKRIVL